MSSPLARGRQLRPVAAVACAGLIPAGAGQAGEVVGHGRSCRAHPRWRGADRLTWARFPVALGSSPLARGRQGRLPGWADVAGLIPAGAGQTTRCNCSYSGPGAHPRWRGADIPAIPLEVVTMGSSPLARGRLRPGHAAGWLMGSSPLARGRR